MSAEAQYLPSKLRFGHKRLTDIGPVYVFSHITNRIDVELGVKLFHHLIALPLGYFGARRVGDSVARVRELKNIRQFITGSSLTLAVDLVFSAVFLGVMAWHSVPLNLFVIASLPIYALVSIVTTPFFRARLNEKFKRGTENQAFLVESRLSWCDGF